MARRRSLDRIELRRVGRQALQMQPWILTAEVAQTPGVVNRGAIPYHDDVTAQMTQQIPQKVVDLVLRDVLRVHTEIQTESAAIRADRQTADHRDPVATVVVTVDGCLTHWRPSASDRGNHHESALVGKDDVGTQPRSVFFTCGQT